MVDMNLIFSTALPKSGTTLFTKSLSVNNKVMMVMGPNIEIYRFHRNSLIRKYGSSNLKKKITYRSNYRGTKEMDVLIGSFVNEIIDSLGQEDLLKLLSFLEHNDENLYKLNKGIKTNIPIEENKITNLFKKYKLKKV